MSADDDVGSNFRISYQLTWGETYYLRVTNYTYISGDKTILRIAGANDTLLSKPPKVTNNFHRNTAGWEIVKFNEGKDFLWGI